MSYNKKIWANGDLITKEGMNNIEYGIYDAHDKINAINNKVEENTNDTNTAKQDISDIKLQIGTEELTTNAKKVKGAINEVNSQIKEKASKDEVRMKNTNITLNDCDSDMLGAIQGGESTSFELLSIPRDESVTPIKTNFLKLKITHNLVDPDKIVQGKKVPMTAWLCEAVEVADENYCYIALELEEGTYILNTQVSGNSSLCYTGVKGGENENKIDGGITVTGDPATFTVSGGTKKYFLNMTKTDYASYIADNGYLCLMKQNDYDIYGFEEYVEKISFTAKFNGSIEENLLDESLKSVIDNSKKEFISINTTDRILETLTNKVINWNGVIGDLNGWKVKLIQLNLGEKLIVKGNSTTGDGSHIGMLEVFSDKTPWKVLYNVGDYSLNAMEHTATKNIEYIYILCKDTFDIKIEQPNKQYIYNTVGLSQIELLRYRFNNAICIGDSLTVGKQPNDSSRECYPSYLAKMTGMEITNAGQSGATASGWLSTWRDTYNYANYECAFICFGTNGGIIKDSDNYNSYLELINKMKNDNPNIVIFLLDCVGNNGDGINANDVIKEIAKNNSCHYLNVFHNEEFALNGMHGAPVSDFHDIEGDPTHLSPMGYLFMARNVVNEMVRTMFNNIGKFNQRHTN